jgi:hypothetical protein
LAGATPFQAPADSVFAARAIQPNAMLRRGRILHCKGVVEKCRAMTGEENAQETGGWRKASLRR